MEVGTALPDRRPEKRARLHGGAREDGQLPERGDDDYVAGSIVEIELHNFMTYCHLTCRPGPRLNLVIGPNGSGKSSLVCAIALGLAADPQILGRASSVGAFVKRGEESGYVKIVLRGHVDQERIAIVRRFDIKNTSYWMLNGVEVSKSDVLGIIKKFNIQINNLTQFLPQDRVCEFAKLTPIQLLEETEKAIGDPDLPIQHHMLVNRSHELKGLELAVKRNEETMNNLKALNAELDRDVERVRQREKIMAKVELMRKKLPWLSYDLKKMEYIEAQRQEADGRKKMEEAAKTLNDLKGPIDEHKKIMAAYQSNLKKISSQITQNANRRLDVLEKECQLAVQVKARHNEMKDLKQQKESRQRRIMQAKEDLAAVMKELEDLPTYTPPKDEMETLRNQIAEHNVDLNQLKMQKKEQENILNQERMSLSRCSERLKEMENKNNKLLMALKNNLGAERIFEAYSWLQEHRSELRKEVYGPVLLEVNVQHQAHASYLEQHVPSYIWKSIITQDASDRDFIVRNLKSYDIPVLNYVAGRDFNRKPYDVTPAMQQLGINSRLDQVFDAPSAVKNVLISQALLDHSYIGSDITHQRADEVAKLGVLDFWTPENHYRWSVSRYSNNMSASVDQVHRSRLFMSNVDVTDIETLRSKKNELEENIGSVEESLRMLQKEQRQLEDEIATLHKQREAIIERVKSEKQRRLEVERRVEMKKRKLEDINKEESLDLSTKKLIEQVSNLQEQRYVTVIKLKDLLVEAVSLKWSYIEEHMTSIELDAKIREMEKDVKQHEKSAIQAAANYEDYKSETEQRKQQLANAKKHAESIAIITEDLASQFLEIPGTIEDLEAAIQDCMLEANSILFRNQNVLEEYEDRLGQINAIAFKLEEDKRELERCLCDINSVKEKWLLTLQDLVAKINYSFSRNFQEMAVAGEVLLDERGMEFSQYGILIKVKFRQTGELQVLSAHHQSGGERSVSTILYLVSLQDLTNCPFRVVDEINQGMDPINERKMFQQLVKAASQPNTPQCFLLTPKLLPDLEYGVACSILNIMNGPWVKKPSEVWSAGDCYRAVMGVGEY